MECNKEEAVRAKEIAEKKMQTNDFLGAQRIAMKAKNLFPELENISQLLAVCDVHCSAQNMCGSEKDWYGILQIERMADEATIKKQYRKLALILHPDKNRFPGAEAAFKLIGEANMVLSDKGKRSLYDIKCRSTVRTAISKPPPHQVNRKPVVKNSYGVRNDIPNVSSSRFSGLNHHQPPKPDLRQTFWTHCPFCNVKYQYYKEFVNRALRCQNCSKPFIAYDLGAQGAPQASDQSNLGSDSGRPAVSQQEQVPKQAFKVGAQSSGGFPCTTQLGSQVNSSKTVDSEQVKGNGSATGIDGGLKRNFKGNIHVNTKHANGVVGISKVDARKAWESRTLRDKNRKKGRNVVVESSESCDDAMSSSDGEEVVIEEVGGNPAARQNSESVNVHSHRRSTRQRQNVSYNENISDNEDFMNHPKRFRVDESTEDKKEQKEPFGNQKYEVCKTDDAPYAAKVDGKENKQKGSFHPKVSTACENGGAGKHQTNMKEAAPLDSGAKKSNVRDDSDANTNLGCMLDQEFYECPDPEFSNFDKDKDEKHFAVDQIWACYDTVDGMPRFYAQVRKVFSPGFKLRFTWLEANPDEQGEIDWVETGLPVGCGKFIRGETEETSDRLTFSHQIDFKKGSSRGSYVIYPRKGETWALFKDWDIRWSSEPEYHKKNIFQIVEILSDYCPDAGIKVEYLVKVKGFLSLFQRTYRGRVVSHLIPSGELLRFSHRIPSFKMTGAEGEGVPEGSFELDPASLPNNPSELWQPEEEKAKAESMSAKINGSSKSSEGQNEIQY